MVNFAYFFDVFFFQKVNEYFSKGLNYEMILLGTNQ